MRRRADISKCGRYRYLLQRIWGGPLFEVKTLVVCMLNPSTADGTEDDATIRWLIGWAKKRGYGAINVVNLAAYRATSPRDMLAANQPHGSENGCYLVRYTSGNDVLCAWGSTGAKLPRYAAMLHELRYARLHCIATNKDGSPSHPLRRSHSLEMEPWTPKETR